jgi:hypothetical protein
MRQQGRALKFPWLITLISWQQGLGRRKLVIAATLSGYPNAATPQRSEIRKTSFRIEFFSLENSKLGQ